MENLDKIEIAKRLITSEFFFLEEVGYEKKREIVNDETFIACMLVNYTNNQKKRKVSIVYSENKVCDDIKYSFGISVSRIPYLDVEDFFGLDVFLDSVNANFSTSMINHFDEAGADSIVKKLNGALKYYAMDIIEGKEWLDNYWARW